MKILGGGGGKDCVGGTDEGKGGPGQPTARGTSRD